MKIFCFRDAVIATELLAPSKGVNEDETPRGRKISKKGGINRYVIMAVDLYFIVPNRLGWYAQMLRVQDHFARNITKWNEGVFEYQRRELSEAKADGTYYRHSVVKALGAEAKAFAYEISDIQDDTKSFKYHGYYSVKAWRNKAGNAIMRPLLPCDWDIQELTMLARAVTS